MLTSLRVIFVVFCIVIAVLNFPVAHGWYTYSHTWWDVIDPLCVALLLILVTRRRRLPRSQCANCGYIQEPQSLEDGDDRRP